MVFLNRNNYLNQVLSKKDNPRYAGPKSLYKYRPFDQFSFDMLENDYIFLCVASGLDDPSECVVTIDIENCFNEQEVIVNFDIFNNILQFVRPYTSQENYEKLYSKIQGIYNSSSSYEEFMSTLGDTVQELACDTDINSIIDLMKSIPVLIDNSPKKGEYERVIRGLVEARNNVGICSLAESNDIEDMWMNYANNYSGYCVEFDMADYEYNKYLLPVIYEVQKETDLINSIVKNILGQTIFALSKEQIDIERNHILKLLTTKDVKWSYQKEWRLVGDANFKLKAPPIKRIIIGSNVEETNKNKMIEICEKLKIKYEIL